MMQKKCVLSCSILTERILATIIGEQDHRTNHSAYCIYARVNWKKHLPFLKDHMRFIPGPWEKTTSGQNVQCSIYRYAVLILKKPSLQKMNFDRHFGH